MSFTASATGTTIVVTATRKSYAAAASTSAEKTDPMSSTLGGLASGGATGTMATLVSSLDAMSAETLATTLNQLLPYTGATTAQSVSTVKEPALEFRTL